MKKTYGPGITVDVDAIARGLFELCKEHPDGACLRFGMLPAQVMESFERNLKPKIPDLYFHTDNVLGEINGKRIRQAVVNDVAARIIGLATESGICEA